MSKRDRQAVRTARDVEQKYNLGGQDKKIKEAKREAEQARKDAERIYEQAKQSFQKQLDEAVEGMEQSVAEVTQTANEAHDMASEAEQLAQEAKQKVEDSLDPFDRRLQEVEKKSQDNADAIVDLPTKEWVFNSIYPVGSIYLAYNHTNPGILFPGTTWERIENAFPWFTGETGTIGQTGGERTVTLTKEQIPAHNHGGTYTNAGTAAKTHAWLASGGSAMAYDMVDTGGGESHNNMPPYIQISAWRRTE